MNIQNFQPELAPNYTIFHRYWVRQEQLIHSRKKIVSHSKLPLQKRNSLSTVHKCRIIRQNLIEDYQNFYVMKVSPYIPNPQKVQKKSKQLNQLIKTSKQIQSQYIALKLLSKCNQVSKIKQIINENSKRLDDKQFFYLFLKKKKYIAEKYVCVVTEYCNDGNVNHLIQNKNYKLNQLQIIHYSSQIILGLSQLKKKKIIHRNLKLNNILLHNNQIKFTDFSSCFICGKSTWNDLKNGIDISISPPEIIQLISKPDDQLKNIDSFQLYLQQQKCDIYYFGLALFKMIYGYNFDKFNKQTLQNMVYEKLSTCQYNENLLKILVSCLQQKVQNRIDLTNLYKSFTQIQKNKYFQQLTIDRLYLSQQPIFFATIKNLDSHIQIQSKSSISLLKQSNYREIQFQQNFYDYLTNISNHRFTNLSKIIFSQNNINQMDQLWKSIQNNMIQSKLFKQLIKKFMRTLQIHSFYYQCLYKSILSINLKPLKNKQHIIHLKSSKHQLQQQLIIILSFLFKLVLKTPFIRDLRYHSNDLSYQINKLFFQIIQSDIILNKMYCYQGKQKQIQFNHCHQISNNIKLFFNQLYQHSNNFQPLYQNIMKLIQQIITKIQKLLKNTIINLRIAYDNIHLKQKKASNIKQILLILIALQQINLNTIKKNQMIAIWNYLRPFLNQQIQIDAKQADMIFTQYKNIHFQEQLSITNSHKTSFRIAGAQEKENKIKFQEGQSKIPDSQQNCDEKQKNQQTNEPYNNDNISDEVEGAQLQQKYKISITLANGKQDTQDFETYYKF